MTVIRQRIPPLPPVVSAEGLPAYSDIRISLTTEGDVTPTSGLGLALERFPAADASGDLNYERTIPASMLPEGTVGYLDNLHIVQHGIDVNGNGMYDLEALGEPTGLRRPCSRSGSPHAASSPRPHPVRPRPHRPRHRSGALMSHTSGRPS
ncbi:MAG: hypothetical protein L0H64_11035 [Pseudonocardia sp.]|nr:hypothetical protein [Pseudonocardia sp.]